eukprot:IDg3542t1
MDDSDYVSPSYFAFQGRLMMRQAKGLCQASEYRRFRALFGVSPTVCSLLWSLMCDRHPPKGQPRHLLWSLMFLK